MSSDEEERREKRYSNFASERFDVKTKFSNEEESFGPVLPPSLRIEKKPDNVMGPSLPHFLLKPHIEDSYGPMLPPKPTHTYEPALQPSSDLYGPPLPPSASSYGPTLQPSTDSYGPALPSKLTRSYGPALPEGPSKPATRRETIGPELPEHLKSLQTVEDEEESEEDSKQVVDDFFGPCPSLMTAETEIPASYKFNKPKPIEAPSTAVERESWMVELPKDRSLNLGLGARQFRAKLGPDKDEDKSCWTDTPSDKAEKKLKPKPKDDKKLLDAAIIEERDREMEKLRKKVEKKMKRKETLMEIHEKKLRKQAKKEAKERLKNGVEKPERRPFNRDTDLQVNRFDEAQKRAVLKKAQLLDDRFSRGESKFL